MIPWIKSRMDNLLCLMKLHVGAGGNDCVGECVLTEPPFLRFRGLRVIMYEAVPPSGVRINSFAFFLLPAGDAEIDLHEKDIITIMPCPETLANAYRTTMSGIQIGSKEIQDFKRKLS